MCLCVYKMYTMYSKSPTYERVLFWELVHNPNFCKSSKVNLDTKLLQIMLDTWTDLVIGHVNTHSHLWKFATSMFICGGLYILVCKNILWVIKYARELKCQNWTCSSRGKEQRVKMKGLKQWSPWKQPGKYEKLTRKGAGMWDIIKS